MSDLHLQPTKLQPWAPHPTAAPLSRQSGERLVTVSNGTRTSVGGWQIHYDGLQGGRRYRIEVVAEHDGVDDPRDMLRVAACWSAADPNDTRFGTTPHDNLLPSFEGPHRTRFAGLVEAPEGLQQLTIRTTLRWTPTGEVTWRLPRLAFAPPPEQAEGCRVAVVTGIADQRRGPVTVESNTAYYSELTEACCRDAQPDLLLLPEVALQWRAPGHAIDTAVEAVGPEVQPFRDLAARFRARIGLGIFERDGDAVRNTCLLIDTDGGTIGRYWKVHLAAGGEDTSGVLPGDTFPVFETAVGRLGCNICMDSSAAESSRMVGLNGADFLLLPIMGDHRASRFTPGTPLFNESRWLAIQRTHAMDNQLTMVVARNQTHGSCVIDRKGDVLAWNEGDRDHIVAEVPRDDGYRTWNGGCFRDVNWMQRRPHLYGAFVTPDCVGGLRQPAPDSVQAAET